MGFRKRLIEQNLDWALVERTVALAARTGEFGARAAGGGGFQPAGLYLAMLGLFGLGLGAIIRSSVGAVAIPIGAAVRALDHHAAAAGLLAGHPPATTSR